MSRMSYAGSKESRRFISTKLRPGGDNGGSTIRSEISNCFSAQFRAASRSAKYRFITAHAHAARAKPGRFDTAQFWLAWPFAPSLCFGDEEIDSCEKKSRAIS